MEGLRRFKFFRVLLPGFYRRLYLPPVFTKYFIQENNTMATLLSPLGKSWHVRICRDGNTLNFEEGWEKFAEDHKLAMGDFLVFKHIGSLVFDVTIFDATTCERQYHSGTLGSTSTVTNDKTPGQEEAPNEEELSNISEEASKGFRRQETSLRGKRAAEPIESVTSMKRCRSIDVEAEYLKEESPDPEEPDVTEEAPKFEAVTRLFRKSPYVEIPAAFAAANKFSSVSRLFLKDPSGAVWQTNVGHYRCRSQIRSQFSRGWRRFCAANNVDDGDVCVFELRERNTLHVQVRKKVASLQTICRSGRKTRPMKAPKGFRRQEASSRGKRAVEPMESVTSMKRRRSIDVEVEYLKERSPDPKEPDVTKEASKFEAVTRLFHNTPYVVTCFLHVTFLLLSSNFVDCVVFRCHINDVKYVLQNNATKPLSLHLRILRPPLQEKARIATENETIFVGRYLVARSLGPHFDDHVGNCFYWLQIRDHVAIDGHRPQYCDWNIAAGAIGCKPVAMRLQEDVATALRPN